MIKAIETIYNGYRFRSRLEARWAVFFDTLGVKYEYEPEGYELLHIPKRDFGFDPGNLANKDKIYYLPDFLIPHLGCWVEIKPTEPTKEETYKAAALGAMTDMDVFIFFGEIPYLENSSAFFPDGAHAIRHSGEGWDTPYLWCECPDCGLTGIEFDGRSDRLSCKKCYICQSVEMGRDVSRWASDEFTSSWSNEQKVNLIQDKCPYHPDKPNEGCERHGGNLDKGYNYDSPRLLRAYAAARQARFGKNGRG